MTAAYGQTPPVTQIGVFCVPIAGQQAVPLPRTLHVDVHGHVLHPTAGRNSSQLPRTQTSSWLQRVKQSPQRIGSLSVFTHA